MEQGSLYSAGLMAGLGAIGAAVGVGVLGASIEGLPVSQNSPCCEHVHRAWLSRCCPIILVLVGDLFLAL